MAINKVVLGDDTLIDISNTTATEDTVANGEVFYKANGVQGVGVMANDNNAVLYSDQTLTSVQQIQARSNIGAISLNEIPYANQNVKGLIRAYTTSENGKTVLNLWTE